MNSRKAFLVLNSHIKNTIRTLLLVMMGVVLFRGAAAAESGMSDMDARIAQSSSLADILDYAYQSNPSIKAAKASWRGAIEKYRVETGYPDPQLSTVYWPLDPSRTWSNRRFDVSLTQTIPYPGKLGAAGRVAEAESQIARLKLDKTARDVAVKVRKSYYELLYIREAMRIAEQNRQALDHLQQIAETAYAGNRVALYDVLKAKSQAGQVQYDGMLLQELEQTEITRLNALLNRPPDAAIGKIEDPPMSPLVFDLKAIYQMTETHREEIQEAEADVEKSHAEADVAKFQNRPEFMVGFTYEYNAPNPPGTPSDNMYGIQFGMTLPIWPEKNAGRREAAQAGIDKASATLKDRINEARALIRETYFRLKNAQRLVSLYRDQLLPQATKAMETAETWNRENQGSFADYVETESVWYNFQLALARARADYGKYLATLEGLAGVPLTGSAASAPKTPSPGEKP